jgi:uroporphyrinogen-III synthase
MRVIVTRPAAQAAAWVADLRRDGFDAVAMPLIAIAAPADPAPVQQAWHRLADHALVFFVSANAVLHFFALRPAGASWPAGTRAAAPGPGTAAALRAQGLPAAAVVEPAAQAPAFDSESLWAGLHNEPWAGRSVLVVRGENGRDWLAEQLRAAGATVLFVAAYARAAPQPDCAGQSLLAGARAAPGRHLWLLSSSEAVQHLVALWGGAVPAGARALASHPRIAQTARDAGFAQVLACAPDPAAVRQAIRGASIQSAPS